MKKHLSVILILLVAFALVFAACDTDKPDDNKPDIPWTPEETFSIIYMVGDTEYDSQLVDSTTKGEVFNIPEKDGYIFTGWFQDFACTIPFDFEAYFSDPDKQDVFVYAGFEKKSLPQILYYMDDQEFHTQEIGPDVSEPISTIPGKFGYTFTGWYADKECTKLFDFDAYFALENKGSIIVYAGFEVSEVVISVFYNSDGEIWRTQTIEADTDAPIAVIPTKSGYKFTGWYADEACTELFDFDAYFADPDKQNVTVYAGFERTIQITYMSGEILWDVQTVGEDTSAPSAIAPALAGSDFVGWYADQDGMQPFDFDAYFADPDKDSVTVWALFRERTTISYMSQGEVWRTQDVGISTTAPLEAVPSLDGYEFVGWYADEACETPFDFDGYFADLDRQDITVYAGFEMQVVQLVYMNGDDVFETQDVDVTTDAAIAETPTRPGYDFTGWYADADCTIEFVFEEYFANANKASETTIYAGFEMRVVQLTYMNGDTTFRTQNVNINTNAPITDVPTKDGYEFTGWYADETWETLFDFDAYFANADKSGATVYAGFERMPVITYMNGADVYQTQYVSSSTTEEINSRPAKMGYEFTGWYAEESCETPFDFESYFAAEQRSDVTVWAGYKELAEDAVQIIYISDGKSFGTQTVTDGTNAPITATPTKDGYTFTGWYADEACETPFDFSAYFANADKESVTVYAGFEMQVVQLVYMNGDDVFKTQDVDITTDAAIAETPTRPGYDFTGWYADADCTIEFVFEEYFSNANKASETTIYAGFEMRVVQLTYMNGDTTFRTQSVNINTNAPITDEPTKDGYTFTGWYADEACETPFDFSAYFANSDKESVTVYAGFEMQVVQLVYMNGDDVFKTQDVDITTDAAIAETPTRPGYDFTGWYADADCTIEFVFEEYFANANKASETTIYAGFAIRVVQLTYMNGSEVFRTQSVNVNTAEPISDAPSKNGYAFTGWYADAACKTLFDFDAYFANADKSGATVYAGFEKLDVQIVYMNGDQVHYTQTITESVNEEINTVPVKSGYKFTGWYTDADCKTLFDFDAYFADLDKQSVTVYAGFERAQVNITYYANGEIFNVQQVTDDTTSSIAAKPSNGVLEFTGWYEDEQGTKPFNFEAYLADPDKVSVTVYAGFALNADCYDMDGDGLCDDCNAPVIVKDSNNGLELYDYRVGYIAGNSANNTVNLGTAIPGGSSYTLTDGNVGSISGTQLTVTKPGTSQLQYRIKTDSGKTVVKTVTVHVLDGYTNVSGSWSDLYNAIMKDGNESNVVIQAQMTAPQNAQKSDGFVFVDCEWSGAKEDYPEAGHSPNTLNLYGNALKWDVSGLVSKGYDVFRIEWTNKTINITDVHMSGANTGSTTVDPLNFNGYGAFFVGNGNPSDNVYPTFNVNHCMTENGGQHYRVAGSKINIDGSVHRNSCEALIKSGTGSIINVKDSVLEKSATAAVQFYGGSTDMKFEGFVDVYNWKDRDNPQVLAKDEEIDIFITTIKITNADIVDKIHGSNYDKYFAKENGSSALSDQYLNLVSLRVQDDSTIEGSSNYGLQEISVKESVATIKMHILNPSNVKFGEGTWRDPKSTSFDNSVLNYELVHGRS